jgi:hypothetical protein
MSPGLARGLARANSPLLRKGSRLGDSDATATQRKRCQAILYFHFSEQIYPIYPILMNIKCQYHGISQRCSNPRRARRLFAAQSPGHSCISVKEYSMQEKMEWEIVDEAMPQAGSQRRAQGGARASAPGGAGMKQILLAMMGPWWRWKLLGAALFGALALVMLAMLTGVLALVAAVGTILAIAIGKLRQWTRRHSGALTP